MEKLKCSKQESMLLGCKKDIYKLSLQFSPEVSCKSKSLKKAFEGHFYLSYNKKYGFKILDVKFSGKRLVMSSLEMMDSLKKNGFNKVAISQHLNLLSSHGKTFRLPKRRVRTRDFLAKFNKPISDNRVPASL